MFRMALCVFARKAVDPVKRTVVCACATTLPHAKATKAAMDIFSVFMLFICLSCLLCCLSCFVLCWLHCYWEILLSFGCYGYLIEFVSLSIRWIFFRDFLDANAAVRRQTGIMRA